MLTEKYRVVIVGTVPENVCEKDLLSTVLSCTRIKSFLIRGETPESCVYIKSTRSPSKSTRNVVVVFDLEAKVNTAVSLCNIGTLTNELRHKLGFRFVRIKIYTYSS